MQGGKAFDGAIGACVSAARSPAAYGSHNVPASWPGSWLACCKRVGALAILGPKTQSQPAFCPITFQR